MFVLAIGPLGLGTGSFKKSFELPLGSLRLSIQTFKEISWEFFSLKQIHKKPEDNFKGSAEGNFKTICLAITGIFRFSSTSRPHYANNKQELGCCTILETVY